MMTRKEELAYEIRFFEGIVSRQPHYVDALIPLAELYTRNGQYTKGLEVDRLLSRLKSDDASIHYNLACSLCLCGNLKDAFATLKKACDLGYNDFAHLLKDKDLKVLREHPDYAQKNTEACGELMKVLFAGDSEIGGAANYLLGILRSLKVTLHHIPPGRKMTFGDLKTRFDVYILSDYSRDQLSNDLQKKIVEHVGLGSGLVMVGGWASFSGNFGKWQGSLIEKILPVSCLKKDDRRNISGGLIVHRKEYHEILKGLSFAQAPVICGLNEVRPKKGSQILMTAKKVLQMPGNKVKLDTRAYPLLVITESRGQRTAAFATDFAPHWCGGLVDWGEKRRQLPVNAKVGVEVGHHYIRLVTNLLKWLARKPV